MNLPAKNTPPTGALSEFIFEVREGDSRQTFRMTQETLRIGRGKECDIILSDTNVSRLHAILQRSGNNLVLLDNNTRNGTFVNGSKVQGHQNLQSGDKVEVANTIIHFRKFMKREHLQALQQVRSEVPARNTQSTPQRAAPDREETFEEVVQVAKNKGSRRFVIYGVVGLFIGILALSDNKKGKDGYTAEDVQDDPIGTYQAVQKEIKKGNISNELVSKAAEEIAANTSRIIIGLEASLEKEEAQRKLDAFKEDKEFRQPKLTYTQKLGQEHFFHGLREYNYQNFARAERHFSEAKTIDPDLSIRASEFQASATNRRRLLALREYKLANKYMHSKRFEYAISKFQSVMNLLEGEKKLDNDWARIYSNCELFVAEARNALGTQNFYGIGTTR